MVAADECKLFFELVLCKKVFVTDWNFGYLLVQQFELNKIEIVFHEHETKGPGKMSTLGECEAYKCALRGLWCV